MSKAIVCDVCGERIEQCGFFAKYFYEFCMDLPNSIVRKKKMQICDKCYLGFENYISEIKDGEQE